MSKPNGVGLADLCDVLRSKNAGPYILTCDIVFRDARAYSFALDRGIVSRAVVADLYGVAESDILVFESSDDACAIKVSMKRRVPAGTPGDSDCYGMSQEAPLLRITMPPDWK